MTSESLEPSHHGAVDGREPDILAKLWEEAPFARLPIDAPAELKDHVQDVENPRRVYAIYRASRRHDFQLLVEKYITQLRAGCGVSTCTTATCFSCRKRMVGKAPIRRYNATSARTLAVYLASQDYPERGLCPNLKPSQGPAYSTASLILCPKVIEVSKDESSLNSCAPASRSSSRPKISPSQYSVRCSDTAKLPSDLGRQTECDTKSAYDDLQTAAFVVEEQPMAKDHRSFAANVFGMVAYKMLEWLTPNTIDALFVAAGILQGSSAGKQTGEPSKPVKSPEVVDAPMTGPTSSNPSLPVSAPTSPAQTRQDESSKQSLDLGDKHTKPIETCTGLDKPTPFAKNPARRNSNARVRTSSTSKPKRKMSMDPYTSTVSSEEIMPGLVSPRLGGLQGDKPLKPSKAAQAGSTRSIPEISAAPGFFDHVNSTPPARPEFKIKCDRTPPMEEPRTAEKKGVEPEHQEPTRRHGTSEESSPPTIKLAIPEESMPQIQSPLQNTPLPQSLSRLTPRYIDLFCDILQEDGTSENSRVDMGQLVFLVPTPELERVPESGSSTKKRKRQWKLFIEQSLFYVLSDPSLLIGSFTADNELFDSHTLYYCLARLHRVVPSLLFDSLWIAAGKLFAPPKSLHSLYSPTRKGLSKADKTLSNLDAGRLLAICIHALVASAPVTTDANQLRDVSRIRSGGRVIGNAGSRQPSWTCLDYDDAFSNELAIRLARRLCSAITVRRCFAELAQQRDLSGDSTKDTDVLGPLLDLLDPLNSDKPATITFRKEDNAIHDTRMTTLILDWARAVLLEEWDGNPEFRADGPFAGAIALLAALYEKRQSLHLGDPQFRVDYLADRLDSIEMPVAWLAFTPCRHKLHLLDYPFIFDPETLVSYFRSINFSRMSRSYEESSSIEQRMSTIFEPSSLITNPHHKDVLKSMLQTAACRFLIIDTPRENIARNVFDQLWNREERELLRPLKVHLGEQDGEEGFDSGGVQQEFFRLVIAECLDPKYGAFTIDDRTKMAWFVPGSVVELWRFELVGLLVSLAVYNGLTLPITFPKALYRKLLGQPVEELHHIADGWPDLANGLMTLLEWDETNGLVEDVFCRTYEFSVDTFGQPLTKRMDVADTSWPQFAQKETGGGNGSSSPATATATADEEEAPLVTNENRSAYVTDYIRFLTDVSVRPQFAAFARGFAACLHPTSLRLLSASQLQSLVEGEQDVDVAELRKHARYIGWDATHRTIKDFWAVVRRYDGRMRRRLLEFVTASDRVPVGGVKNLQFVVQRNGEGSETGHLPTAYTCYGTLLLPEYTSREVLRERLGMALEYGQGFGFP